MTGRFMLDKGFQATIEIVPSDILFVIVFLIKMMFGPTVWPFLRHKHNIDSSDNKG